jgi:hypothetical protein
MKKWLKRNANGRVLCGGRMQQRDGTGLPSWFVVAVRLELAQLYSVLPTLMVVWPLM